MAMTGIQRKAALVERGIPQVAIARKTGFSGAYVYEVLMGTRRSAIIEQTIAQAIGRPVDEVFEPPVNREAVIEAALGGTAQ